MSSLWRNLIFNAFLVGTTSAAGATSIGSPQPNEAIAKTGDAVICPSGETLRLEIDRVRREVTAMAHDVSFSLRDNTPNSTVFSKYFLFQVYARSLNEAMIFRASPKSDVQTLSTVNPQKVVLERNIDPAIVASLGATGESISVIRDGRLAVITRLPMEHTFLYAARLCGG